IGWIPDGDHSFKPRKSSGRSEKENVALAIEKSATFITSVI
ncbi:MAG: alpha/beta family hydrolase, partial [Acidobacteriota bacterium]